MGLTVSEQKLDSRALLTIFIAFIAFGLDLMDWNLLAFSASAIAKEFNFTGVQMGYLLGAPLLGAGLGGLVAGWLADKVGRKKAMIITLIWFSLFTVIFGLGKSFTDFIILRLLAGFGLGAQWGVGGTLVAETVPARFRMRASAIIQSGAAVGPLVGALSVKAILPVYGWRPIFYLGAAGLALAIFVWAFIKESDIWLKAKEKHELGTQKQADISILWRVPVVRTRFILVFLMLTIMGYAYYGASSWIPTWLATTKGMGIVKSMNYMIALNVGGFIGFIFVGAIADKFGRKVPAITCLFLSVAAVLIFISIDSPSALLWFAPVYAFITYPIYGLFGGFFAELFPTEIRSTALGAVYNIPRMFAFFAPSLLAFVGAKTSLSFAIGATAVVYFLAIIPLLFLPETKKIGLWSLADEANKKAV